MSILNEFDKVFLHKMSQKNQFDRVYNNILGTRSFLYPKIENPVEEVDPVTGLLIHSDTTNNSTIFTDSSTYNHTISRYGALHKTAQQVFGASSIYTDGVNDYLSIADHSSLDLSSAYTIDFWFYPVSIKTGATYSYFFNKRGVASDAIGNAFHMWWFNSAAGANANKLSFGHYTESGSSTIASLTGIMENNWYHIAVTYDGNNIRIFKTGVLGQTVAETTPMVTGTNPVQIGGIGTLYEIEAYFDEIRIVNNRAVWTSNFTPPSSAYA